MGMTDLQFKSHLRHLIADLRRAKECQTLEEVLKVIDELEKLLQEDLES